MPTPKRPQPEFPPSGFIGKLPNPGGGYSSEYSITIPHPTVFGHWTNVPLLVPGQEGTNALPGPVTDEQVRRAQEFAVHLAKSGYDLPAFKTEDEAAFQAGHRHKSFDAPQPDETGSGTVAAIKKAFGL